MARPKRSPGSAAERRVVGDLAYAELLSQALPLLSEQDRRIIDLSLRGFVPSEVADAMQREAAAERVPLEDAEDRVAQASSSPAQARRTSAAARSLREAAVERVPLEDAEDRVAQASSSLAQACRTIAAARSLLSQATGGCRAFASFAAEMAEVVSTRKAVVVHIEDSAWDVRRFEHASRYQDHWHVPGERSPVTRAELDQAKARAMEHFVSVRQAADRKVAALERDEEEIVARAAKHASTCPQCQQEVTRTLGRDWSPF